MYNIFFRRNLVQVVLARIFLGCLTSNMVSSNMYINVTNVFSWPHIYKELWLIPYIIEKVSGRKVRIVDDVNSAEVILSSIWGDHFGKFYDEHKHHAIMLFIIGENCDKPEYREHKNPRFRPDIVLGHYYTGNSSQNYVRYPWWTGYKVIIQDGSGVSIDTNLFGTGITAESWNSRPKTSIMLSRHDGYPRSEMMNWLTKVTGETVDSPGGAFSNMKWPGDIPQHSVKGKLKLTSRYKFIICPENSLSSDHGYVTEKLIQAHLAGTIPIYWGDASFIINNAAGDILNPDRILFYHNDIDNNNTAEIAMKINRLITDESFRKEWFSKPLLAPNANDWLQAWVGKLSEAIRVSLKRINIV